MYKKISRLIVVVAIFFTTFFTININGKEYSINDLIENGKDFDKANITISGEAIGEALDRGDYTWININDGTNAIGIYMSSDDANKVSNYGGFKQTGDTLEVRGVFNRACKEHGGDMDIHAKSVSVAEKGKSTPTNISSDKVILLSTSSLVLVVIAVLYYLKVKKTNNK
ncbi:MAG: hypothetical protein ACRC92_23390 [Peptostreptococcaceae bacterium]